MCPLRPQVLPKCIGVQAPELAPDAVPLDAAPALIAFDGVSFGYGEASVLRDISFDLRAGQTLGIAGPSGSGKTTLLNLVARFYDPSAGVVRIDGTDLRRYRLTDVYAQLAIVTQEPFLFTTTVRDNIRVGRPGASDPSTSGSRTPVTFGRAVGSPRTAASASSAKPSASFSPPGQP